jgi:hypothetical protein
MGISINPNNFKIVENQGLKFFNNLSAIDKFGKKVKISIENPEPFTSIKVHGASKNPLGFYDINLSKSDETLEGVQLYVNQDTSNANLGQILTLSSLIEFKINQLKNFKLFTLKEAIPFHAKYGFVIDNDNPEFLLDGMKQIKKSKVPNLDDLKQKASLLMPKLSSREYTVANDPKTLEQACKTLSEYIKYLSRLGLKKEEPTFDYGTRLKLSTWDFEKNKVYLNELLKKHKIDFQF